MTIAGRLKEERDRLGFTQTAFGALAGVTKMTQINYEKGKGAPDAGYLSAVQKAGVDVLYVLTGERMDMRMLAEDEAHQVNQNVAPYGLKPDEAALLDNYRHSSEEAQAALRATSAALAQSGLKKRPGELK